MGELSTYILKQDYSAPSLYKTKGAFSSSKPFKSGQSVQGYYPDSTNIDVKFIVTNDGFAIPERVLNITPAPSTAPISASLSKTSTLPKELQDKLNAIKSTDIVKNIVNTSRTSVNGLLIGALIGGAISIFGGKPFMASVILGSIGGGMLGYGYSKHNNKQNFLDPANNTEPATTQNTQIPAAQ